MSYNKLISVPIIPDYLERINMKSEVTQLNNNDKHFETQLGQISTSSSVQSSSSSSPTTTPPSESTVVSLSSLFVSTSSYVNDNIFTQWNQSNESLWRFGEKISYRRLFEGEKVVNQEREKEEEENDDDGDDREEGEGAEEEDEDDNLENQEIGNENVVKSKRSSKKSNNSGNILMEGDSDWRYNHHGNEPIDWKSLPIRGSKIIKIILEDKVILSKRKYQNHGKDSKRIDYDRSYHKEEKEEDNDDNSNHHHHLDPHPHLQSSNSHSKQHLHHHYHFHNHFRHSSNQGVPLDEDKIDDYHEERLVGTLFASKAIFQLIFNPISRKLIQRLVNHY